MSVELSISNGYIEIGNFNCILLGLVSRREGAVEILAVEAPWTLNHNTVLVSPQFPLNV